MLSWVMALYSVPSAQVKVNCLFSPRFSIGNYTRQGCPLWPLFFFCFGPQTLFTHSEGEPGYYRWYYRLLSSPGYAILSTSANADDVLFHLTNPLVSLPNLMREFQRFGMLSNLKINCTKLEILPIQLPYSLAGSLQAAFSFTWAKPSLKYLGIRLTDNFDTLYAVIIILCC